MGKNFKLSPGFVDQLMAHKLAPHQTQPSCGDKDFFYGVQIHRAKIEYTPDEFRERYPVGMLLQIVTTTEVRPVSQSPLDLNKCLCGGPKQ